MSASGKDLGYRAQDLSDLWRSTRQMLLDAANRAKLQGIVAYTNRKFPPNLYEERRDIVSHADGADFIAKLTTFVTTIATTANKLTVDLVFRSSPEPAVLMLFTQQRGDTPRYPSPVVIQNIYRGWYDYRATASDCKDIDDKLNLIDQNISELDCFFVSWYSKMESYPCSPKIQDEHH
jgi:hypothetical protein